MNTEIVKFAQRIIYLCVSADECITQFIDRHPDSDLGLVDAAIAISEIRRMFDPVYDEAMKPSDEVKESLDVLESEDQGAAIVED